jgi:hypothetical protein
VKKSNNVQEFLVGRMVGKQEKRLQPIVGIGPFDSRWVDMPIEGPLNVCPTTAWIRDSSVNKWTFSPAGSFCFSAMTTGAAQQGIASD